MSTDNNSYQYVYNVGLLDDLHNYFPAFLYDSGRFQTPAQIFNYLHNQINARFNLPAHGARLAGFVHRTEIPVQNPVTPRVNRTFDRATAAALVGLLDLSGGFLGENSYFYSQPATFMEPVPVRASEEIISRNTTIQPGSESPEGSACAICQDVIVQNDVCRKLNACTHVYHKICIDQWFLSNVQCPTCRRDIRERNPTTTEEEEPATT
jgi:hypothetical protein